MKSMFRKGSDYRETGTDYNGDEGEECGDINCEANRYLTTMLLGHQKC
jgi:hypothetical protein